MTCAEAELRIAADPRAAREDEQVRAHVAACPACGQALLECVRVDDLVASARPQRHADRAGFLAALEARIDREASTRPRVSRFAWAAAVAAALIVASVIHFHGNHVTPIPPSPVPSTSKVTLPSPPPVAQAAPLTAAELCAELHTGTAAARREALAELGRRGDSTSRAIVLSLLDDATLGDQAVALAGRLRCREAIPTLSRIVADPARARAAIDALAAIGGEDAAAALLRLLPRSRHAFAAARALHGMETTARKVISERAPYARGAEASSLLAGAIALRASEALPWIVSLAEQGGPDQTMAISALGVFGDVRTVPALARISREAPLHAAALEALSRIGDPAVRELAMRTASGRREDRLRAINLLGELRSRAAVASLVAALGVPDLRSPAARALGAIGDPSCAPALAACLDDPGARAAALEALSRVADASTVPLLGRLASVPSLRRDAVRILGETGSPDALPYLAQALSSRDTVSVAVDGLVAIGVPAIPLLIRALADRDVTSRARGALARITAEDLGDDPGAWVRWWKQRQAQPEFIFLSFIDRAHTRARTHCRFDHEHDRCSVRGVRSFFGVAHA